MGTTRRRRRLRRWERWSECARIAILGDISINVEQLIEARFERCAVPVPPGNCEQRADQVRLEAEADTPPTIFFFMVLVKWR